MDWSTFLAGSEEVTSAALTILTKGITVLIGIYMVYSGLAKMVAYAKNERQGQSTAGPVLINLAIGSIMLQFASVVDKLIFSMFASERQHPTAVLQYMPSQVADSPMLQQMMSAAALWVALIGFVAICRGLISWNDLANGRSGGQESGWKGFWHIIFGAVAVNLPGVLALFS